MTKAPTQLRHKTIEGVVFIALDDVLELFHYDSAIAYGANTGKYPARVITDALAGKFPDPKPWKYG